MCFLRNPDMYQEGILCRHLRLLERKFLLDTDYTQSSRSFQCMSQVGMHYIQDPDNSLCSLESRRHSLFEVRCWCCHIHKENSMFVWRKGCSTRQDKEGSWMPCNFQQGNPNIGNNY